MIAPHQTAETVLGNNGRVATNELAATEQLTTVAQDTAQDLRSSPSYFTATKRTVLVVPALFAVILLVIVAAASWRYKRGFSQGQRQSNQLIAQTSATPPDLRYEQITTYGNVISAAISPDGKQVAYVRENSSQESLWLIQLATSLNIQLIPPGDVAFNKVSFSHDGDYLYFSRHAENEQTDLYRIPVLHGPPTKLLENLEGNYSLSADDRRVVFKRRNRKDAEDTLYIAELDSGQERPLVTHKQPDRIWAFSLSPNGKTVVFATGETDSGRATMNILEVDTETGQEKLLLKPNWYYVRQFEWLPEGDGLLVCGRESATEDPQIWRMSYPSGALLKLTNDLNNYLSFSVNADASKMIAVQSQLASHIWVSQNINGSKGTNVADGRGRVAWTADGRIIFNSSSVMGSSDLWIAKPDGSDPKQLSFNTGFNDWPAISTDSRTIVFQSNRTGVQHLWRMNLDGSNQVQLTNGYAERNAAISPDGKWVYFNSSENSWLWKIDSNGGQPVQLTNEYAAYPSVSPNGKLIACFHFPRVSHEARITVRSTDDMKTVAELTLAPGFWISRSIQWDADNATLFYASESEGKTQTLPPINLL
jgi:Tol biopolymer transport system component